MVELPDDGQPGRDTRLADDAEPVDMQTIMATFAECRESFPARPEPDTVERRDKAYVTYVDLYECLEQEAFQLQALPSRERYEELYLARQLDGTPHGLLVNSEQINSAYGACPIDEDSWW